jgi:hypothetical protein
LLRGRVVGEDDRIDIALADAPGDDLGVLRPKIEDDDLFSHGKVLAAERDLAREKWGNRRPIAGRRPQPRACRLAN